jgi:hypothetical protein
MLSLAVVFVAVVVVMALVVEKEAPGPVLRYGTCILFGEKSLDLEEGHCFIETSFSKLHSGKNSIISSRESILLLSSSPSSCQLEWLWCSQSSCWLAEASWILYPPDSFIQGRKRMVVLGNREVDIAVILV